MKLTAKIIDSFFKSVFKYALQITTILLLLDTYTYFFIENKYLSELLNFASEKTPATWVSSTILLILSGSFFLLWHLLKQKKWLYSGLFFIYLSLDDASYIHEQISSWITNQSEFLLGLPSYGWLYIIAPIIFLGLFFVFYNIYREKRSSKISIKNLYITITLLTIAISLDFLDGLLSDQYLTLIQTHYLRVTEEAIEIIAFAFLMLSVSLLLQESVKRLINSNKKEIKYGKKIKKRRIKNR